MTGVQIEVARTKPQFQARAISSITPPGFECRYYLVYAFNMGTHGYHERFSSSSAFVAEISRPRASFKCFVLVHDLARRIICMSAMIARIVGLFRNSHQDLDPRKRQATSGQGLYIKYALLSHQLSLRYSHLSFVTFSLYPFLHSFLEACFLTFICISCPRADVLL
jgi:hypothetical protein